ncbi:phosphotransferase [Gordonia crocea]|uniref:Phosphotransferase n=1 Tax=Gordonia crocea TaxID=589162 RepID=A0A7I9UWB6_9ACTN|nr:phosphotransferase [Gordonia crocea]GED97279.1 phosphotransferase [Gordonia crocea]
MAVPFSSRVGDPVWRDQAVQWSARQLGRDIDEVVQPRIRPWSTHLRLSTGTDRWWFKANCTSQAFEPALRAALHELLPDRFDEPVAVDPERGWRLTADRGPTWGEQTGPVPAGWAELIGMAASIQRRLVDHGPRVTGLGVPDCSPPTVVARYDRLTALLAGLHDDHPAHLPPELHDRLRAARPTVAAAADTLAASPLPATWQHGDLHPRNVFHIGGMPTLFDLGDSQWAHPVEILCVPHDWIGHHAGDIAWEPLFEAYADAWGQPVSVLAREWVAARLTWAVNRAMTWWDCLAEADDDEWRRWGDAPLTLLARVARP